MMKDPQKLVKNRKELVEEMIDKYGYIFCQKCGFRDCGRNFEVHHIIFRSEAPKHPRLHDKINLIIVSDFCHKEAWNSYHKKKDERNNLIKERKLNEVFGKVWGYQK